MRPLCWINGCILEWNCLSCKMWWDDRLLQSKQTSCVTEVVAFVGKTTAKTSRRWDQIKTHHSRLWWFADATSCSFENDAWTWLNLRTRQLQSNHRSSVKQLISELPVQPAGIWILDIQAKIYTIFMQIVIRCVCSTSFCSPHDDVQMENFFQNVLSSLKWTLTQKDLQQVLTQRSFFNLDYWRTHILS